MPTQIQKTESSDPVKTNYIEQKEEDSLESPIQVIANEDIGQLARDLSFMAEPVEVMILPSYDEEDTTRLVTIGVNGKSYYLMRGEWQVVPRFVLEVIVRAKKEAWTFGYRQSPNGATFETNSSSNLLRYPHHFKDTNPKGLEWYNSIKDQVN